MPDLAGSLALDKEENRAIQTLREELEKLVGQTTDFDKIMERLTTGSWKDFREGAKETLISIAGEITAFKSLQAGIANLTEYFNRLGVSEDALQKIQADLNEEFSKSTQDLAFETSLIGKRASEQKELTELRRIDLRAQQAAAAIPEDIKNDPARFGEALKLIKDLSEQQKKIVSEALTDQLAKQRDWVIGAKSAFQDYADAAMNAAEQAKGFITNSLKSMEDALVELATTGKLNFKDLANSIIKDLTRISIQKNITGPLSKLGSESVGTGGALDGLLKILGFGGGAVKELGYGSFATGTDYVPRTGMYKLHEGEAVVPAGDTWGGSTFNFNFAIGVGAQVRSELNSMRGEFISMAQQAVRSERNRTGDAR